MACRVAVATRSQSRTSLALPSRIPFRWPDRAAMASSAAGRSGRARFRAPSTSLMPTAFSRGQMIRVGLTTGIRHGNASDVLVTLTTQHCRTDPAIAWPGCADDMPRGGRVRACRAHRVAGNWRSDSAARVPSMCSGCCEAPRVASSQWRRSSRANDYTRRKRQSTSADNFPACEARPRRGMPSALSTRTDRPDRA